MVLGIEIAIETVLALLISVALTTVYFVRRAQLLSDIDDADVVDKSSIWRGAWLLALAGLALAYAAARHYDARTVTEQQESVLRWIGGAWGSIMSTVSGDYSSSFDGTGWAAYEATDSLTGRVYQFLRTEVVNAEGRYRIVAEAKCGLLYEPAFDYALNRWRNMRQRLSISFTGFDADNKPKSFKWNNALMWGGRWGPTTTVEYTIDFEGKSHSNRVSYEDYNNQVFIRIDKASGVDNPGVQIFSSHIVTNLRVRFTAHDGETNVIEIPVYSQLFGSFFDHCSGGKLSRFEQGPPAPPTRKVPSVIDEEQSRRPSEPVEDPTKLTNSEILNSPLQKGRLRYPKEAEAQEVEGEVRLKVTIAPTGEVISVEVVSSSNPGWGFEDAAIAEVKGWRFKPSGRTIVYEKLITFRME